MKQSTLFTKTRKEGPKDEVAKNAVLLIKAGFIHKEMAGVYSLLPLGLRVFKNIENIIREEMNMIGGQEVAMTALQEKSTWEKTNRWSDDVVDNWFKTKLKNDTELGLAFTHEEPLTQLMKNFVSSYRNLPCSVYQFQTKFRNETRAKSGIIRTREFVMKDLYSFSKDEAEHLEFYDKAKLAYKNIFNRMGIGHLTYLTFASGGVFSKFSHEFQTISESGEDVIYIHKDNEVAINKEVFTPEVKTDLGLSDDFKEAKAVEVGNIFTLGTRFSDAFDLSYTTEDGDKKSVFMGSYGIGPARIMGTIVEVLSDENGIIWPASVAPFKVHLLTLGNDDAIRELGDETYKTLTDEGIEVLYDDRDVRPGEKFADSDLIGIPTRVIVGNKTIESKMFELKDRATGEISFVSLDQLLTVLK